jgi:predicted permease
MIRRILTIRSRRAAGRHVDDEMRFHIEMRTDALVRSGATPEAARAQAIREFGDVAEARRELTAIDERAASRVARADWWRDLTQDARYALRGFRRQPAFTAILLATLAIGIGANAAIFAIIDAVQLRPLPVRQPARLVALGDNGVTGGDGISSVVRGDVFTYLVYKELRDRNAWFSGLLASGVTGRLDVLPNAHATELEHPSGRFVSGNYFSVLGVGAALGRTFDGSEDKAVGVSPVVVVSHNYWTRRFGSDSAVIGRQITIDRVPFTVIGVAANGFFGEVVGTPSDIWIPITMQPVMQPSDPRLDDRNRYWLQSLGRLKPGVTMAEAISGSQALVREVLAEQMRLDPARTHMSTDLETSAAPGATGFSEMRDDFQRPLFTLMIGVGLLMLIVCANVGNLLLARAVARTREMSVRIAIGAGRSRLVRQLLTESAVLAVAAGTLGLLIANWGSRLLIAMTVGAEMTLPLELHNDWRVLLFTAGISFAAVMIFGLAPAVRATRLDIAPVLRSQGRGSIGNANRRRFPVDRALIAAQVGLSLVLLVAAALLVTTMRSLERVDPGFDRDHVLLADVDDVARGLTGDRHIGFVRALNERLAVLPGVTAVSFSENGLFSGSDWSELIGVDGFVAREPRDSSSRRDFVGPGYVRAIGARLIDGRDFTARDVAGSAPVALVNQEWARFYLGSARAVGRTLTFKDTLGAPMRVEIVGVVSDVRTGESSRRNGASSLTRAQLRRFYLPYLQHPGDAAPSSARFEIRTAGDPAALVAAVRRTVSSMDPLIPVNEIYPLRLRIRESLTQQRLLATLSSGFGALALFLAALGLYGVMMHAVTRRTGEMGLRMALGADRGAIVGMVVKEAMRLLVAGLALGIPGGILAVRLLRTQLPGVGTLDPTSLVVAFGVLLLSGVVAALVPAVRAGRVAPIIALTQE